MRLILILLLSIGISLFAQSELDAIAQLIELKHFEQATLLVDKVLAEDAENGEASFYKGFILMKRKDNGLAMTYFKKALQYPNENKYKAYNEMAFLYMLDRKYEDAYEAVSKAMRLNKENHRGYYVRGKIQAKEGNYPAALASMNKAIRLNRQQAEYFVARGRIHQINKNFAAACIDFAAAKDLGYDNLEDRIKVVCD
jgi:tetratricopeptide (TPR) repeat protein